MNKKKKKMLNYKVLYNLLDVTVKRIFGTRILTVLGNTPKLTFLFKIFILSNKHASWSFENTQNETIPIIF